MLFDFGTGLFESEKERNLYCKFFGGYFFNELLAGVDERVARFCRLLDHPDYPTTQQARAISLSASTLHVSFDNHAYLFENCSVDMGELADILVHDHASRTM